MSKRFKGKGYADKTARIGANCEIEEGAVAGRYCFLGPNVILRSGAYVRSEAEVLASAEIMADVVVPSGASVKGGYRVHAILDAGLDARGYHVIAALVENLNPMLRSGMPSIKHWRIWAGCRDFTVAEAVEHWTAGATACWQYEYARSSARMLAKVKYLKAAIKLWHREHGR